MKRVRVYCQKGVPPAVRRELRRLAKEFSRVSPVAHDVFVTARPYPSVPTPEGNNNWGVAWLPLKKRRLPLFIDVAAVVPRKDARREYVRGRYGKATAARAAGHTMLHELAHFEQWRDQRPIIERGVNVRAAGLYRRIDRICSGLGSSTQTEPSKVGRPRSRGKGRK